MNPATSVNPATDEHPNADDYRNRAERAEQELAEAKEHVRRLEQLAQMLADDIDRIRTTVGTAGNGLAAYTLHMLG